MNVYHTDGKVFITFHRIKWENLAATENTTDFARKFY